MLCHDEFQRIARLSILEIRPDEEESMRCELSARLGRLRVLDSEGEAPLCSPALSLSELREDIAAPSLSREALLPDRMEENGRLSAPSWGL